MRAAFAHPMKDLQAQLKKFTASSQALSERLRISPAELGITQGAVDAIATEYLRTQPDTPRVEPKGARWQTLSGRAVAIAEHVQADGKPDQGDPTLALFRRRDTTNTDRRDPTAATQTTGVGLAPVPLAANDELTIRCRWLASVWITAAIRAVATDIGRFKFRAPEGSAGPRPCRASRHCHSTASD